MTFEVVVVKRQGADISRETSAAFNGAKALDEAAAYAASLAILGRVVEVWALRDTLQGTEKRIIGVMSWWAFKKGAATITYDTDYLD